MSVETTTDPQTDQRLELVRRSTKTIVQEKIPGGTTPTEALTLLLPDDDPGFAERGIALGAEIVRTGQDVSFRHLRVADLPE